jgi:hypothetical protein
MSIYPHAVANQPTIPGTPGIPSFPTDPELPQEPQPDDIPGPIDPDPYPKYRDAPPPRSIDEVARWGSTSKRQSPDPELPGKARSKVAGGR